ncbi:MAG: Coenzyme F420 hydrogenase/dehydrogenase, beta subunit C-terminal domain [Eubacterium sp.]|nr:Coenzyme F420 hydrogenase/dehydrogenase, beta subunit C-terminal domain [Eubacterium sp.]
MQRFFRYLHSDTQVNKNSSSGGAFTMISDYILDKGGVVYGCSLNDKNEAVHTRTEDTIQRDTMRGSKYIQSNIAEVLELLSVDLKNGKKVLFSGTPCQCAAIYSYLDAKSINDTNLLTVEVICHGVGSNRFFRDYIEQKERKYKSKAVKVRFRAKYREGQKQDMAISFENGKEYHSASTKFDWWYSIYLKNLVLRPSCYKCKYAKRERVSDLSLGDFWGYKNDKAYSLIVCNTNKGLELVKENNIGDLKEVEWEDVHQPYMISPPKLPKGREKFWDVYIDKGYDEVQRMIGNNTLKGKMKYTFASFLQATHLIKVVKKIKSK